MAIYEATGVTEEYLEGSQILAQIELAMKYLDEISYLDMAIELKEQWQAHKLLYQKH